MKRDDEDRAVTGRFRSGSQRRFAVNEFDLFKGSNDDVMGILATCEKIHHFQAFGMKVSFV